MLDKVNDILAEEGAQRRFETLYKQVRAGRIKLMLFKNSFTTEMYFQ